MVNSPVRILLAEFFPSFNKGELAILNGILKSFEVLGEVEVAIFSFYPEIDRSRYPCGVKLIDVGSSLYFRNLPYNRSKAYASLACLFAGLQHFLFMFLYAIIGKKTLKFMYKPLWEIYCQSDVFILCTDEVDCVNGSALKFSPLYISWLAKTLRKPIVFYANGTTQSTSEIWIWKFHTRRLWRFLANHLLSIVDLVTVREEGTFFYFKEITGGKVPIYLTADPAFLCCPVTQGRVKEILLDEKIEGNERSLIGVGMTYGVLSNAFKGELESEINYRRAIKEIARLLDRLIGGFNSTIVFVPHSIEAQGYRDDRIVAKDIYGSMVNKHMVKLITKEYSAEELKGLLGQLDLLISCRCHAAIGALSMGTPTLVLSHPLDRRIYNIVGKMVKQEKWIYNVENLNPDELFALASNLLQACGEIREVLPSIVDSVKEKALLNGKLLRALLDSRLKTTAQ